MSNSVVFLLIAVGLSVLGSLVVWLHGRPRRQRGSSVDHFSRGLRALATDGSRQVHQSGVTVRMPQADDAPVVDEHPTDDPAPGPNRQARPTRPSPRPSPRPVARTRNEPPERERSRPGS